jgi:hypothetical protein
MPQISSLPFNYNYSNTVYADDMQGSSLAEKITNAGGDLAGKSGVIVCRGGGTYAAPHIIDQMTIIKTGHTLLLYDGVYQLTNRKNFIMEDYSRIFGNGPKTIMRENVIPWAENWGPGNSWYKMIAARGALNNDGSPSVSPLGANKANVTRGLEIANLKFEGVRANRLDTSPAVLDLCNVHDSSVHDCLYEGTSGYAVQVGIAASNGGIGTAVAEREEYSKNFRFYNNTMKWINSQYMGIISSENIQIFNNIFQDPGKRPITITSISNTNPAVFTTSENHSFASTESTIANFGTYSGTEIMILGAAGMTVPHNQQWHVDTTPSRNTFTIAYFTYPGGAPVRNKFDGTNAGTYSPSPNPAKAWASENNGGAIDFESNDANPSERNINALVVNNTFDFRRASFACGGIAIANPGYIDSTATGNLAWSGHISNNVLLGADPVTAGSQPTQPGSMTGGITMMYENGPGIPANKNFIISNNYIEGCNAAGIIVSGDNITVQNNVLVDCGKNGVHQLRLRNLKNSVIKDNTIKCRPPFGRYAGIEEVGVNTNNTVDGNILENTNGANSGGNNIMHNDGSTVTKCRYINNKLTSAGGDGVIYENSASNNNIYDNNLTGVAAGNKGIFIVGPGSKIISHKQTDGRVFIPNLTQANP